MEKLTEKQVIFNLSENQYEKLKWIAYQQNLSKSAVLRQLIENASAETYEPGKLDAMHNAKLAELNVVQAQIKELEAIKQDQKIAEPVKKEKYEILWEDAVNLTIRAMPNNKENVVADGNATYIRSFGFKVTAKDILNEAYKRKGLMHKIEPTVKERDVK